MDTPITKLRNKMTPMFNFFKMMEKFNETPLGDPNKMKLMILLDKEFKKVMQVLPSVEKTIKEIPDDAIK